MLKSDWSAATQLSRLLPTSTYWPSQKSAPFGVSHCAVHPPCRSTSQLPWQLTWQSRFACAVHEPLQHALHFASQVALGGVPSHFALHSPLHVAWHEALHEAESAF